MIHWIQQEFQIIRSGLDKEDPMIHGSCPVSKGWIYVKLFFFPVAECPVITLPSNTHTDTDNGQEGTVVGKFLGL